MKINEIVTESIGTMPKHHHDATTGAYKFRDDGTDRGYNLNQIMKATACADGKSTQAIDMDHESFGGKNNLAYPYTEAEHNMMRQAFNTVGDSRVTDLVKDHRSVEAEDTHKVSPIKGFKGYKRK